MEVRTLIKRGTGHHVYCEDDLFHFNIGSTYIGAVFDGCSTGTKSHFASALYGKILKKYQSEWLGQPDSNMVELVEDFREYLYSELRVIKKTLRLDPLEMLSTMIFVAITGNTACILVSGDGCILVDDEEIRIESEGNAPNYLAYHLKSLKEAQDSTKIYEVTFTKSLSICSDGIYSFTNQITGEDVTHSVTKLLLKDETLIKSEAMLARKYNLLTKSGYSNYDDLSIIRFIL